MENGSGFEDVVTGLGMNPLTDDDLEELDVHKVIKTWELEQSCAIQDKIEHLTLIPPFDKDPQLLGLSGMVSLWIADISKSLGKSQPQVDEQRTKASAQFRLAKANGATVWKEAEFSVQDP